MNTENESDENDLGDEPGCRVVTREVFGIPIQTCDKPVVRIVPRFFDYENVGLCLFHSHELASLS